MKTILLSTLFAFLFINVQAQCPDLNAAMVNSCGISEGNNEFVVFTTTTSAAVSTYTLNYGSSNPPTVNNLAGSDATTKTGLGSLSGSGCTIVEVTSPATVIPAGSRIVFISAAVDQSYDLTSYCAGGTMYVVYIKINSAGGLNSSWNSSGTLANSLPVNTKRYLQVTYSGSASCNGTNAPVKFYQDMWASNLDGNFVTWTGTTPSYSNSGCTTFLPVTLVDFNVIYRSGNAEIKWTTANELNSDHFEIQRSFDGNHFQPIGRVEGAGNSYVIRNYQFTDKNIAARTTYYRLITIDKDASFNYSRIVKINPLATGFSVSLYPTPAVSNLTCEWTGKTSGIAQIVITDVTGRTLLSQQVSSRTGINNFKVPVQNLAKGMYMIVVETNEGAVKSTFLKQ
ncbi:hypothetical protein BH09BAC2_BH09BAC2_11890 [soil metagenome]